jgi:ATP-dependent exoDNAse (exonuclease V) beta subunit
MSNPVSSNRPAPPDQLQRQQALDPARSILVQAPAGSGKTDLLTRRFLRLLAEVEDPGQIVAITFTKAAAAEMRHRILGELEKAGTADFAPKPPIPNDQPGDEGDEFSMDALASRALARSRALGWNLVDLPNQLRITTIDAFCRELAIQQPLLSGLGGSLEIAEQPAEIYRRAARSALEKLDLGEAALCDAIESLLLWRDNGWNELEELLIAMLGQRDRWMHGFVLGRETDWDELRERLEQPFVNAVRDALTPLDGLLRRLPSAFEEAVALARFSCETVDSFRDLAEMAEFPRPPFSTPEDLEEAQKAYANLANLLLTLSGTFRARVDKSIGFPTTHKREKERLVALIEGLRRIEGLEAALHAVRDLPPARYSEDDWQIVRACFALLRAAAGELQIAFAESGTVDYTEISQIAQRVLRDPDGQPTDAALAIGEKIRHLLVDEFQDTSRRQHQLLASLIAAWPERPGRTCFAVGDPMQSIYFFRDADAELFPRVRDLGLEIPGDEPLLFDFVPLKSNFRTEPRLVERLNAIFQAVFAAADGSGVTFSEALPARDAVPSLGPRFNLHLKFIAQSGRGNAAPPETVRAREEAKAAQVAEAVSLIQGFLPRMEEVRQAREQGPGPDKDRKFRIAVLGRSRTALAPIAAALREAAIPFRAVDLEPLKARPEVLDALALARALLNPQDRIAWLGVLRAPWCGLSLADLHALTSADDPELLKRPVPALLAERLPLAGESSLSEAGRRAVHRVLEALDAAPPLCAQRPAATLGTWIQQVWLRLGGDDCVDAAARANLDLLWNCLDRLPNGEVDLLGPALNAALDNLTAQPDPAADSDCCVQLMTIHKSKGLEFEVVLVPELQARAGNSGMSLLTWLERGLSRSGNSGEITEFLIAPVQSKGADAGKAKAWVGRKYRERETQEMRRILYVAATRAREELHFFARPAFKADANGSPSLAEPTGSLLATAWPALEAEVRARFEQWQAAQAETEAEPAEEAVLESIAAASESNLLVMPPPAVPTLLRRLPADYQPTATCFPKPDSPQKPGAPGPSLLGTWESTEARTPSLGQAPDPAINYQATTLYTRHQGGLLSRALGTAVHSLLEEFARLRTALETEAACTALALLQPRIAAQVRATGLDEAQASQIASRALEQALGSAADPMGAWILSPHTEAASELRWTGLVGGGLRSVRVDRIFRAAAAPRADGDDCWWIIDYKTAHEESADPAASLAALRPLFAPQLSAYAEVLRALHGADARIRAGLYYPRMSQLDWWEA